jgi:hypothetical protein
MTIALKNPTTGELKVVPSGFSWTTFCFGIFPALFRGDLKAVLLMMVSGLCTLGFSWLAWPFFYNGFYKSNLMNKGWVLNGTGSDWDPQPPRSDQPARIAEDDPIARYLAKKEASEQASRAAVSAPPQSAVPAYAGPAHTAPAIRTFGRKS